MARLDDYESYDALGLAELVSNAARQSPPVLCPHANDRAN